MAKEKSKRNRIAFITTPLYRKDREKEVKDFVYKYLYSLSYSFDIIVTGRTYSQFLEPLIQGSTFEKLQNTPELELIKRFADLIINDDNDLANWRKTIEGSLKKVEEGLAGMIHVTYDLIEGRIDGVIHLTDWQDKSAKPDSAVLSREANVHNVPIATNVETAEVFVKDWISGMKSGKLPFRERNGLSKPPLTGIKNDKVIAMVAHDGMKLELCRFAVKNAKDIFTNYDYILATGTTGTWLQRFMEAMGRTKEDIKKIHLCNSGPQGGDIQIAYAVVKGLCHKVIFLQDPNFSHPHDSDIRLFEQSTVTKGLNVRLATNVDTAEILIKN